VDSRGTPGYRAPELLNPGVYNEKVDIWALGCILYELVKQLPIFDSDSAVYHYSQNPDSLGEIPFGGELVGLMLQIEPDKRPSASEIHKRLSECYKTAGDKIIWPQKLLQRGIHH
jgi:serine/threonine protein kinase